MLNDGFREGTKARRTAMDCGLFLAKIINQDLTVGNATAWQFWNAFEPGRAEYDTRYYLIALQPNAGHTDGSFAPTKNLWALGHFSLFVKPGMYRLQAQRSDNLDPVAAAQDVMVSAYTDDKGKLVMVAINYQAEERKLQLDLKNFRNKTTYKSYLTTASPDDNLKLQAGGNIKSGVALPARSITTLVLN
jgi:O-glycosyl hydrolase